MNEQNSFSPNPAPKQGLINFDPIREKSRLLKERQTLCESLLGPLCWNKEGTSALGVCPGIELHTTPDGPRDCIVYIDGPVISLNCFHFSCQEEIEKITAELRDRDPLTLEEKLLQVPSPSGAREKLPKQNRKLIETIISRAGGAFARFLKAPGTRDIPDPEAIIDQLYPDNPWLCIARISPRDAGTTRRENFRGSERTWEWIVPNPMTAPRIWNQRGYWSYRCAEICGPRKYRVLDFDSGSYDEQIALIRYLATKEVPRAWPFMIVESGNRSLHAWYTFLDSDFFARAVALGADRKTGDIAHLFRFPGGRRTNNGNEQKIIYYVNPQ